jgi:hypothetical protein
MGADAFVAFYGIKLALDPDDEETLDACGDETDPRCVTAKRVGLQTHSGRMTDGEDYFLYIGERLGWLGLEHASHVTLPPEELLAIIEKVKAGLAEAGLAGTPALHLQFIGQY